MVAEVDGEVSASSEDEKSLRQMGQDVAMYFPSFDACKRMPFAVDRNPAATSRHASVY